MNLQLGRQYSLQGNDDKLSVADLSVHAFYEVCVFLIILHKPPMMRDTPISHDEIMPQLFVNGEKMRIYFQKNL